MGKALTYYVVEAFRLDGYDYKKRGRDMLRLSRPLFHEWDIKSIWN